MDFAANAAKNLKSSTKREFVKLAFTNHQRNIERRLINTTTFVIAQGNCDGAVFHVLLHFDSSDRRHFKEHDLEIVWC